jgi:hypothetical protein
MNYTADPHADISGTCKVADLEIAPVELVRALGAPHRRADDYKVSGEYRFVAGSQVFTIYDWKSTSLYGEERPSPHDFWNSQSEVCFSIGSNRKDVADFKRWILETLRRAASGTDGGSGTN